MHVLDEVPWGDEGCTIRDGIASWSPPGGPPQYSIKLASRNILGHVTRSGEVPAEATPAMFVSAIRNGRVSFYDIAADELAILRRFLFPGADEPAKPDDEDLSLPECLQRAAELIASARRIVPDHPEGRQ